MDGKGDPGGGSHGLKVLDLLRKHLLDTSYSSSKSLSTQDVCSSFVDLTNSVRNAAQKSNSGLVVSQAVELLVHACSSQDHHIRVAASENLRLLIKVLMHSHLSRIQQDLFHELKKNGTSRSLCVALDCFAALFPLTRPSKCSSYAQSLIPVLVRLTCREEEALLEALQDALENILPTMAPFLATTNLQLMMTALVKHLPTGSATYRRMASSGLLCIILNCKSPSIQAEWLMIKVLDMGCNTQAKSEIVQGVLLVLQQLFSNITAISPPFLILKQSFCFVLSCLLYRDANTRISALECMHQILISSSAELSVWFISEVPKALVAVDYWLDDNSSNDNISDTHSIGEGLEVPCDSYFEYEDVTLECTEEGSVTSQPSAALSRVESGCLASNEESCVVISSLFQYLVQNVLKNSRVSAQSLGLACVTAAIDIHPSLFVSLDVFLPFTTAQDPKLRNRVVKLLSTIVSSLLRSHHYDFSRSPPLLRSCCDLIVGMLDDSTPVVLKAVCEALQLCLPSLVSSSHPEIVIIILHKLLTFQESSYWLTKVELLQTLGCLNFTALSIIDHSLPKRVVSKVVFQLLGDVDYRVRAAACHCIVRLTPSFDLCEDVVLSLAKCHSTRLFLHLHSSTSQLSLAGIGDSMNKDCPKPPLGLKNMLWFIKGKLSSSVDVSLQYGCLEVLHSLCKHFPPPSLPDSWGCTESPCTLLSIALQIIGSSKLVWGVQAHGDMLEVVTSLFLSCALAYMPQKTPAGGQAWSAFSNSLLITQAMKLFNHTMKLLCVLVHIIEEREPEIREKKILRPVISPKKPLVGDSPSPNKSKTQLLEPFQKKSLVPSDGLGQFANLPHFLKVYDACKAAYGNYKFSLAPVGTDKFSKLLQDCHNSLAALLEVAMADDIGKHVEEILGYISYSVKVDPAGGILCVQQLLNALFGLNAAAQHTHLYSPYISSLPYHLVTNGQSLSTSVYDVIVTEPLSQLLPWFQGSLLLKSELDGSQKRYGLKQNTRGLLMTPTNPVSSIKDYIGHFEPLVVHALALFSSTSSTVLQQRIMFLLVQLLHLKVRYELLDCHHTLLDSVLKLISLMETGVVKGGETLLPHLFQFLVLLAYDQSKLITVPEIMQKCDGVLASGHNVLTFAIPALQPLVLNLFVRPARENQDLEIQREVVVSMLLRLVEHSRVVVLLTHVLDCYKKNKQKWNEASNQIFAALLSQIGKLRVVIDNSGSLVSLYQLLASMDPKVINIEALFTAILKPKILSSITGLMRWLGVVCVVLAIISETLSEESVLNAIRPLSFILPTLDICHVKVSVDMPKTETDTSCQLAAYFHGVFFLAASALDQLLFQRCKDDCNLLSFLMVNLVLLLQRITEGPCKSLQSGFALLPESHTLSKLLIDLSTLYPLLTLSFVNFLVTTRGTQTPLLLQCLTGNKSIGASSCHLLQHCTLLVLNEHWKRHEIHVHPEVCIAITKSPALFDHYQKTGVEKFISLAQENESVHKDLVQLIDGTDTSNLVNLINVIRLVSSVPCKEMFHFLCCKVVPHPVAALGFAGERLAVGILQSGELHFEPEAIKSIIAKLQPPSSDIPYGVSILLPKLYELSGSCIPGAESPMIADDPVVIDLNKEWYVEMIKKFCSAPNVYKEVCAPLLGMLELEDVAFILEDKNFPTCLLESCMTHGILLTLNKDTHNVDETVPVTFPRVNLKSDQLHPLLKVSMKRLMDELRADCFQPRIIGPLLRLLASHHQLSSVVVFEENVVLAMLNSSIHCLSRICRKSHPLALQASLDYATLTLILKFPEVQPFISQTWACKVVTCVSEIFIQEYHVAEIKAKVASESPCNEDQVSELDCATKQLVSMLSILLDSEADIATYTLESSLKYLVFSLCRLPFFHNAVMTPPALHGDGNVSERVLDQALMESEVLLQYMQRGNCVGWLNRQQFEERWMQLLGVINQLPPLEGEFPEEYHAYTLNVCAGIQAVTSLLLSTMLRPNLGDPTSSVSMHTFRSIDLLFLGSRPGRKLAHVRKVLEQKVLLQCGYRSSICDYYQSPLLHHYASPHYPPLYSRNIERKIGDAAIGVGQLSLNSLWPVMLMDVDSRCGYLSDSVDVDVKSCMLSLIDLYTHWLASPIHTVQLEYTLHSIILLSDLFSMSAQVEWMLGTMLDVYDRHPHEDVYLISLTVLGMLKATAILKLSGVVCDKVAKIVEKSLTSDSPSILQTSCLEGLLYVTEDPNSYLVSTTCTVLTNYISGCFQSFQRFTNRTLMVVWSLAVSLILQHNDCIKDSTFTCGILEHVCRILYNPNCSFPLFQSVAFGLELMVVNFSLSAGDRKAISTMAANRFIKCDQGKSLTALCLLITCMYTGGAASVAIGMGISHKDTLSSETSIQAREQINNIMERLRHGPLLDVQFLVDLLPDIIVDFLPPMEVLQTVVTDFVSPHQTRPCLSAAIMSKTFCLLLRCGENSLLTEWILLSLESFVQQEPEEKSVWSITCLLSSASVNDYVVALSKMVCYWIKFPCAEAIQLLCLVAHVFYSVQCTKAQQKEQFLSKLRMSRFSSLKQVACYCEQR